MNRKNKLVTFIILVLISLACAFPGTAEPPNSSRGMDTQVALTVAAQLTQVIQQNNSLGTQTSLQATQNSLQATQNSLLAMQPNNLQPTQAPLQATSAPALATLAPTGVVTPGFSTATLPPDMPGQGQPDLIISQIALNPASPTAGAPVHVKVSVYNNGNAASNSGFTVQWWGLQTFANPSCSWAVNEIYVAHGGKVLECDFTYSSPYAPGLLSKAAVDTANTIAESNEGNNQMTLPVTVNAAAAAPAGKPDLIITQILLSPASPTHGVPVHVKVTVYNDGSAPTSGDFTVRWWGLQTFANPSCTWNTNAVFVAHGGKVLECDFSYASPYSPGLLSKAVVDTDNTIAESNEGNNQMTQPVTVQ